MKYWAVMDGKKLMLNWHEQPFLFKRKVDAELNCDTEGRGEKVVRVEVKIEVVKR